MQKIQRLNLLLGLCMLLLHGAYAQDCEAVPPTGLTATNISATTATLS